MYYLLEVNDLLITYLLIKVNGKQECSSSSKLKLRVLANNNLCC